MRLAPLAEGSVARRMTAGDVLRGTQSCVSCCAVPQAPTLSSTGRTLRQHPYSALGSSTTFSRAPTTAQPLARGTMYVAWECCGRCVVLWAATPCMHVGSLPLRALQKAFCLPHSSLCTHQPAARSVAQRGAAVTTQATYHAGHIPRRPHTTHQLVRCGYTPTAGDVGVDLLRCAAHPAAQALSLQLQARPGHRAK